MMIYSNFKGATGKHGWKLNKMVFKLYLARQRRGRRRVTTRPHHHQSRQWLAASA